jgi:hypothetical protein
VLLTSDDLLVPLAKQDHKRKQLKQSHCQAWLPAFGQSEQGGLDSCHFATIGLSSPSMLRNKGLRTRRIHAGLAKQQTGPGAQPDLSAFFVARKAKSAQRDCPQAHSVDISTTPARPPPD